MSRPDMQFVAAKSAEQQAALMLSGMRDRLIRARTQLTNAIRGYAAEFGLIAAKGLDKIEPLLARSHADDSLLKRRTQLCNTIRGHAAEFGLVAAKGLDKIEPLLARIAGDEGLPALAQEIFADLGQEHAELSKRIAQIDRKLAAFHRSNELSRRLMEIPIVGPVGAGLMITKVVNPHGFRSGRMCAAWLGLTPKDHSTAGKQKLGGITRAGDESLRAVLVSGATAYIQQVRRGRIVPSPWLAALLERSHPSWWRWHLPTRLYGLPGS
jgi:transposase